MTITAPTTYFEDEVATVTAGADHVDLITSAGAALDLEGEAHRLHELAPLDAVNLGEALVAAGYSVLAKGRSQ